jgi:hypothetical protein
MTLRFLGNTELDLLVNALRALFARDFVVQIGHIRCSARDAVAIKSFPLTLAALKGDALTIYRPFLFNIKFHFLASFEWRAALREVQLSTNFNMLLPEALKYIKHAGF